MSDSGTIWDRLASCVVQLDEPFRAAEIIGWFRRHYPGVNEASLRAHIQSATSNVEPSSKISGFARRRPLITRVSHGVYVRYREGGVRHEGTNLPSGRGVGGDAMAPVTQPTDEASEAPRAAAEDIDVILLACSSTKASTAREVRDLYRGEAFLKGRHYAETQARPWYVLSGKWGLLAPDEIVAPYDLYLGDQSAAYRTAWGRWVTAQLARVTGNLVGVRVEFLAGQSYVEPVRAPLQQEGAILVEPFRGLRMGEQLGWYPGPAQSAEGNPAAAPAVAEAATAGPSRHHSLRVLTGPAEGGPFEYQFPDEVERFDTSWLVSVERHGQVYSVRHCLGAKQAFGAQRHYSLTLVNGVPEVEGVSPEDYAEARSLVTLLKGADGKLVREHSDVPAQFKEFELVHHRTEIKGPYARDALAVKIPEADVVGWAAYALARIEVRQPRVVERATVKPLVGESAPAAGEADDVRDGPAAVVRALLKLGRSGLDAEWVGSSSFTPNEAANQLLVDDPFAFLLGVIFDQGIPAERAWQAPFQLKTRLGHLIPARIAAEEAAVWEAINTQPKLHRFVERVPGWVVAAARIVTQKYGGDASAIWAGSPTAREVQQRLDDFPGIGQKKAAMAVEILERDLGVAIMEMHGSDIAYDVHVRRVFLRTHLAQHDDLDHMVEVARRANPQRPGEIDLPAWHVGRTWCRAGVPLCGSCPLGAVCPRDIQAASRVRGL